MSEREVHVLDGERVEQYKFLDRLDNMGTEEIIELAMDPERVMELMEISLYPSDEDEEGLRQSVLATELLCTNIFLDVLISGYNFGMDFNADNDSESGHSSDPDSDLDSDLDSGSEVCEGPGLGFVKEETGDRLDFGTSRVVGGDSSIGGVYSGAKGDFGLHGLDCREGQLGCGRKGEEDRLDMIYAMPVSVLIAFTSGKGGIRGRSQGLGSSVVGISNLSRLIFSLMLYDLDWTWRYILSARSGRVVLDLVDQISNPSVFHLLKLIVWVGYNRDCDQDHKLYSGTELKVENIILGLCQNLRTYGTEFGDIVACDIGRDRAHLVRSICDFLVDLYDSVLDPAQVYGHFGFKYVRDELTPVRMETRLSRMLSGLATRDRPMTGSGDQRRWYLGDKAALSDEVVHELLFSLWRSTQRLESLLRASSPECLAKLSFYSGLASGLMLVVNALVRAEVQTRVGTSKHGEEGARSGLGSRTARWLGGVRDLIWGLSSQVRCIGPPATGIWSPLRLLRRDNKKVPGNDLRSSMIHLEMVRIVRESIGGVVSHICMREEERLDGGDGLVAASRGYLVSLVVEILDYVETLVSLDDLERLKGLVEETGREDRGCSEGSSQAGTSVIWEIFDLIIFRGKVRNSVLEEKILNIFRTCFDHFSREKGQSLGLMSESCRSGTACLDNLSSAKEFLVLGYLRSSGFMAFMGKDKRRETWMDDRILRRSMISGGASNPTCTGASGRIQRPANLENVFDSNIKAGVSRIMRNQGRRSFSRTRTGDDLASQGIAEYIFAEVRSIQETAPWTREAIFGVTGATRVAEQVRYKEESIAEQDEGGEKMDIAKLEEYLRDKYGILSVIEEKRQEILESIGRGRRDGKGAGRLEDWRRDVDKFILSCDLRQYFVGGTVKFREGVAVSGRRDLLFMVVRAYDCLRPKRSQDVDMEAEEDDFDEDQSEDEDGKGSRVSKGGERRDKLGADEGKPGGGQVRKGGGQSKLKKRMLYFVLTTGRTEVASLRQGEGQKTDSVQVNALEYERLNDSGFGGSLLHPGTKLMIRMQSEGGRECLQVQNSILLLRNENVRILGGSVESLVEAWRLNNLLGASASKGFSGSKNLTKKPPKFIPFVNKESEKRQLIEKVKDAHQNYQQSKESQSKQKAVSVPLAGSKKDENSMDISVKAYKEFIEKIQHYKSQNLFSLERFSISKEPRGGKEPASKKKTTKENKSKLHDDLDPGAPIRGRLLRSSEKIDSDAREFLRSRDDKSSKVTLFDHLFSKLEIKDSPGPPAASAPLGYSAAIPASQILRDDGANRGKSKPNDTGGGRAGKSRGGRGRSRGGGGRGGGGESRGGSRGGRGGGGESRGRSRGGRGK
ncbi:hypothetical protein OJ253_1074 [Cryptosporidium canis]|uniref:RecQ mediated genome instability protein 1 OB-fold domain-containing protein n=1 Tax=Cryptosporidium canis TaxID=195482 RepID=A0A9D5DI34_9CRYT|nr:hypothetical protein OJ253_1074 [Cryptosporidium canis]